MVMAPARCGRGALCAAPPVVEGRSRVRWRPVRRLPRKGERCARDRTMVHWPGWPLVSRCGIFSTIRTSSTPRASVVTPCAMHRRLFLRRRECRVIPVPGGTERGASRMERKHPRAFTMIRHADVSGVSGTGQVLDGVVFADGVTVIRWCVRGKPGSTEVFATFDDFATSTSAVTRPMSPRSPGWTLPRARSRGVDAAA